MKLVVIIPTANRKEQVNQLLAQLERQHRAPDEVIVTAPDKTHVKPYEAKSFTLSYAFGKHGLCAQRNHALDLVQQRFDVITFFDDDFMPANNYLRLVEDYFEHRLDWAVVMGHAVEDGARNEGFSFEQGLAALAAIEQNAPTELNIKEHVGAYGCNMSIRARIIGNLRFDERLVLYGWQEDIDFTSQLRRHGRVVGLNRLVGVHLGLKAGRISGVRFGYSQVINPVYLIKKGTVPARFVLNLMSRNVVANLVKSFWPEPYIDRRGRLKGNLLAFRHLMKGRIEPEYILQI